MISIVIPVYNRRDNVIKSISSVITNEHYEVVIVDDHSTDDSLDIINSYLSQLYPVEITEEVRTYGGRIKVISSDKNNGIFVTRNIGLRYSTCKYIGFLDCDDYVDTDYYMDLYNTMVETNSDIVTSSSIVYSVDSEHSFAINKRVYDEEVTSKNIGKVFFDTRFFIFNSLYNKDLFKEIGYFPQLYLNHAEDILLLFIALTNSFKHYVITTGNKYYYNIGSTHHTSMEKEAQIDIKNKQQLHYLLAGYIYNRNVDVYEYYMRYFYKDIMHHHNL